MGLTKEIHPNRGEEIIIYTPNEPHPFLDSVKIFTKDQHVQIALHGWQDAKYDFERQEQGLLDTKHLELQRRRNILENTTEPVRRDADVTRLIYFKAGPKSKIRSALEQAAQLEVLPTDIQEAVMEELQKLWAKTPK